MIKLHECEWYAPNKREALYKASLYTGFDKEFFECEVIKEPKKVGLFKKEDGIYHCWYEYEGMDSDKELRIADATLHFDTKQKIILVLRFGYKAYEIEYSDLVDYEMVVKTVNRTYTVSNKNKALKGAILFGMAGAVVGAVDSEVVSETVEQVEMVIRLKFSDKKYFDIITCDHRWETDDEEWREILEQSKEIDEYFKELLKM